MTTVQGAVEHEGRGAEDRSPPAEVGAGIVRTVARQAAAEVPGVARVGWGGPGWLAALRGPSVDVWMEGAGVHVTMRLVAAADTPLPTVAHRVRAAVASAVERQLGLRLADVTVIVDGIGG